jgi:ferric-dicitrate binding protein FerR (iron transport regulator)
MRKWLDRAGGAEGYQKAVAWHVRARDGDVQEAKRVAVERARDQALRHVEIVELLQIQRYRKLAVVAAKLGIILPPNFDRPAPTADLAALADKARALIQTNDPDAVRQGLGEIADALDAIVRDWDPLAMFRERQAP